MEKKSEHPTLEELDTYVKDSCRDVLVRTEITEHVLICERCINTIKFYSYLHTLNISFAIRSGLI